MNAAVQSVQSKDKDDKSVKNNNIAKSLVQRNNETREQYQMRIDIFNKVKSDIGDETKALVYSNMWVNILSMGCAYSEEIMEKIKKYEPSSSENAYLVKKD